MHAGAVEGGVHREPERIKGMCMPVDDILFDLFDSNAAGIAGHPGEEHIDELLRKTEGFKYPRRLVGLNRGDAHLGGGFDDAAEDRLVVVIDRGVIILVEDSERDEFDDALLGKIGIDRLCPKTEQCRAMVHGARFAAFHDQGETGALLRGNHVLFHRRYRKQ